MQQTTAFVIEGLTPLLMNKYTGDEKAPLNMAKLTEGEAWEYARERAYLTEDGEPILPAANLQQCLIRGGLRCKGKGRGTLATSVAGGMTVMGSEFPISSGPLELFRIMRKNPSTGGKMLNYRIRVPVEPEPWRVGFGVLWDDDLFESEQVLDVVRQAGIRVGLMDWRPDKKGPFGQFRIAEVNGKKTEA